MNNYQSKEITFVLKVGAKVKTIKLYENGKVSIHLKEMFDVFKTSARNLAEAKTKMEKDLSKFFRCNSTEIIYYKKDIGEFKALDPKDFRSKEFRKNADSEAQEWIDKFYPAT